MPCNHPLPAFDSGLLTENGKRRFIIGKYGDQVIHSWEASKILHEPVFRDLTDPLPIPCGHCIGCRMERAKMWSNRIVLESKKHTVCYFITLTYDDYHLPCLRNGTPVLNKRDLQKFWKRLRDRTKFRYFACGEYGDQTLRPHYHAIVFGDAFPDIVSVPGLPGHYKSQLLDESWSLGLYDIEIAESGSMAYVAGYCFKKQKDVFMDKTPYAPFVVMSRRPGIACDCSFDVKTMKIYGDFGSKHYSKIPRYYEVKMADDVLADYKERKMQAGKQASLLEPAIYGLTEYDQIGDAKDAVCLEALKKKERNKI